MLKIKHTICPSCSVGCGLSIVSVEGKIVGTYPYKRHPINEGKNCLNGRESIDFIRLEDAYVSGNKVELDKAIDELVKDLKNVSPDKVTVVCSGNNSNEEIEAINKFANSLNYNIVCYADNFPNYDGDLATYDDINNASSVLIIGELFTKNPLIARRVIKAHENGAKVYAVGLEDETLTSMNSDEYLKVDSISKFLENPDATFVGDFDEFSVIIFNEIENFDNFNKIVEFAKENNSKILPLFSKCNTKGALNVIEAKSHDEMNSIIDNSEILLIFNDDLVESLEYDGKSSSFVATISPSENATTSISKYVIPIKSWVENEGSFTNAMGEVQTFNLVVESDRISEIEFINTLQNKLEG